MMHHHYYDQGIGVAGWIGMALLVAGLIALTALAVWTLTRGRGEPARAVAPAPRETRDEDPPQPT